jgi:hypothetical protein
MTVFDYDRDRKRFELEDEQTGDIRFRGFLIRSLREQLEISPVAMQGYRLKIERSLLDVDRRIAQRALLLARVADEDDRPPASAA